MDVGHARVTFPGDGENPPSAVAFAKATTTEEASEGGRECESSRVIPLFRCVTIAIIAPLSENLMALASRLLHWFTACREPYPSW